MRQATREKIMALISQLINVAELSGRFDAKGFTRITELEEITRLRAEIANLVSENSPALLTPEAVDGGLVERELIGGLVDGIRWWAAQEDGIPQEIAGAFNDGMALLGWTYSTSVDTSALTESQSENALLKDKWVPVGERLPNDQEFVWITDGTRVTYGLFEKDYYDEGDHEWADRQTESDCWTDVTHWQPAATPGPPVKQGEEKL